MNKTHNMWAIVPLVTLIIVFVLIIIHPLVIEKAMKSAFCVGVGMVAGKSILFVIRYNKKPKQYLGHDDEDDDDESK